jgi:TonB family protein
MRVRVIAVAWVMLLAWSFLIEAQTTEKDRPATTVQGRAISNTQGYDFSSYLREVTERVRARWVASIPATYMPGRLFVWMSIDRNGSGGDVRVIHSSGISSFDQRAVAAVDSTKVFPSLPTQFAGNQLTIELEFTHVLVGFDPKLTLRPFILK